MNGIEYVGVGSGQNSAAHKFLGGSTSVFEIYPDKLEIKKAIDMNSMAINLKTDSPDNYIKYSASGMNGIEYAGVGFRRKYCCS